LIQIYAAAGKVASDWEKRGVAVLVISAITCLHAFLPNAGVRFMNAIGVIKIAVLTFIVIAGWVVLGGGTKVQDPHASFRDAFAGTSGSGYHWANSLFKVLNSFAGYTNAAYVSIHASPPADSLLLFLSPAF
jgi:amino acid transporter